LVFHGAFKLLKRLRLKQNINFFEILLLSIWFGFHVQSFVSINQLGLAIWGWVLMGVMSSYELKTDGKNFPDMINSTTTKTIHSLMGSLIILLSWAPGLPPLVRDSNFLTFAKNNDGSRLIHLVSNWPKDSYRFLMVSQGLDSAGFAVESHLLLKIAVQHNPNSYQLWSLLATNSKSTWREKNTASRNMARLDPLIEKKG
jgi:hypothetical protein